MKTYFVIVLNRILEIVSRFFFLGQCLKFFSLEDYGIVSYRIALYQFLASILYSGTLQSLSNYKVEEHPKQRNILTWLFLMAVVFTALLYAFDGPAVFIFLFYSLLYIQNGWFGNHGSQILFSFFRGLSFTLQVLFFTFWESTDIIGNVYLSFLVASSVLLICFPYNKVLFKFLPLKEWNLFFKFQLHNLIFQFTKISERWALLFILDKKTFGLYSSIRDVINAANLTLFSPIYQTTYKKLANGADFKPLLRKSFFGLILLSMVGLLSIFLLSEQITTVLDRLGIAKFLPLDLAIIVVLLSLDFLKAVQLMIFESRHQFKVLYQSHFLDFIILGLSSTLIFTNLLHSWRLFVVLFSRLIFSNIFFGWKNKEL